MSLTRKGDTSEASTLVYDNMKPGDHEARLVYVADLGLQHREYKGEVKPDTQQIALCLEIIGSTVEIDGIKNPRIMWTKPFNIFGKLDAKSHEYHMYAAFNPMVQEGEYADWDSVLGKACNAVVVNVPDKQDPSILYDNIKSIAAIPSKYLDMVPAGEITDLAVGDSEDANSPAIKHLFGLAKYVHAKRILDGAEAARVPDGSEASMEPIDSFDDDIPF